MTYVITYQSQFIPLYIFVGILVGCIVFFGGKDLIRAFKEVKKKNASTTNIYDKTKKSS
jgi:uncharacterized membrane protein